MSSSRHAGSDARFGVVLFDLDNTLSDFTSAQREAFPGLLAEHGVENGLDFLDTFKRLANPLWDRLEQGDLTLDTLNDERFRLLIEHTGLDLDPAVLAPDYLRWLSTSGGLLPGARSLLDTLHGTVRMGLVTNGYAAVQRPRLDHFELGGYFDAVTVSDEIGHAKPSRAFFDVAFEQLGHPDPDTVLVVGDSLSSDMAGGAAAGCATCWFNPAGSPPPALVASDASTDPLSTAPATPTEETSHTESAGPTVAPRVDHIVTDLSAVAGVVFGT